MRYANPRTHSLTHSLLDGAVFMHLSGVRPSVCLPVPSVPALATRPAGDIHRLLPSVLGCCWLGGRRGIRPVKN